MSYIVTLALLSWQHFDAYLNHCYNMQSKNPNIIKVSLQYVFLNFFFFWICSRTLSLFLQSVIILPSYNQKIPWQSSSNCVFSLPRGRSKSIWLHWCTQKVIVSHEGLSVSHLYLDIFWNVPSSKEILLMVTKEAWKFTDWVDC